MSMNDPKPRVKSEVMLPMVLAVEGADGGGMRQTHRLMDTLTAHGRKHTQTHTYMCAYVYTHSFKLTLYSGELLTNIS